MAMQHVQSAHDLVTVLGIEMATFRQQVEQAIEALPTGPAD